MEDNIKLNMLRDAESIRIVDAYQHWYKKGDFDKGYDSFLDRIEGASVKIDFQSSIPL